MSTTANSPGRRQEAGTTPAADRGATYRSVWRDLLTTEFRQGFVAAGGLNTRYVQAGSAEAPAVVMLHGTGGHWETFSRNLPFLADSFDCYALDMVGCGFTDKPDRPYVVEEYVNHVLAFMDAMGIEKASFIGVSLGSWVASRLALTAPQRVDRLILNAASGLLPLPPGAAKAASDRHASALNPTWSSVEAVLDHLFYDTNSLSEDIIAIRQQVHSLPGMEKTMGRMLTLFDPEIRRRNLLTSDEWASITAPTLAVAHVDAPDDYLETARTIVTLMPHASLLEIREASHWPHFEQPARFNQAALEFLRGSTAGPSAR
ncbi:alpha/beta hydrolase [Streptomyces sp. NPDC026665]|uniref:alpha/beta fold hydrolase n=1 Tax=Streptomyces sp. NPDC026665 TaxID=3154798 RepID=UPI0033C7BA78